MGDALEPCYHLSFKTPRAVVSVGQEHTCLSVLDAGGNRTVIVEIRMYAVDILSGFGGGVERAGKRGSGDIVISFIPEPCAVGSGRFCKNAYPVSALPVQFPVGVVQGEFSAGRVGDGGVKSGLAIL